MIIYKTTCLINGKIYIGQTKKKGKSLGIYLGSGTQIKRAIALYGVKNFSRETLRECTSQAQLDFWETYYIKKFNSHVKEFGYNIIAGTANKFGAGSPASLPEVRAKMSETRKGNQNARKHPKRKPNMIICKHCSKPFPDKLHKIKRIFCSKKCFDKNRT